MQVPGSAKLLPDDAWHRREDDAWHRREDDAWRRGHQNYSLFFNSNDIAATNAAIGFMPLTGWINKSSMAVVRRDG
jgi:hypothetical protein